MEQYIKDLKKEYDEDYCIYLEKQLDIREHTIKMQQQEIDRLTNIINKIEEFIQLKIIRYENEKDYMLEPEDILDIYYYLKSLKEKVK